MFIKLFSEKVNSTNPLQCRMDIKSESNAALNLAKAIEISATNNANQEQVFIEEDNAPPGCDETYSGHNLSTQNQYPDYIVVCKNMTGLPFLGNDTISNEFTGVLYRLNYSSNISYDNNLSYNNQLIEITSYQENSTYLPHDLDDIDSSNENLEFALSTVVIPTASGIFLYILSLLTFVGNAMVLHAIRTDKRLQTVRLHQENTFTQISDHCFHNPIFFDVFVSILSVYVLFITQQTKTVEMCKILYLTGML